MRGPLLALAMAAALTVSSALATEELQPGQETAAAPEPATTSAVPSEGAPAEAAPAEAAPAPAEAAHAAAEHGAPAGAESAEHAGGGHAEGGAEETHGPSMLAKIFNFVLFFGVLGYLVRKPFAEMLRKRKAEITDSLSAAERARAEAERKLAEMDAKLQALDSEVAAILAQAREQAANQGRQIVEAAEAEAARVLQQAESQVAGLEAGAVRRLREAAADLAIEMAREMVVSEMKPEDRQKLFDRYVKSLQKVAS